MKGPGNRIKFPIRRTWECPVCHHKDTTLCTVVTRECTCKDPERPGERVWMKLVDTEEFRPSRELGEGPPPPDLEVIPVREETEETVEVPQHDTATDHADGQDSQTDRQVADIPTEKTVQEESASSTPPVPPSDDNDPRQESGSLDVTKPDSSAKEPEQGERKQGRDKNRKGSRRRRRDRSRNKKKSQQENKGQPRSSDNTSGNQTPEKSGGDSSQSGNNQTNQSQARSSQERPTSDPHTQPPKSTGTSD